MKLLMNLNLKDDKMKTIKIDKDIVDVKGWTIPKGSTLYIEKETEIKNPTTGKIEIWRTVKVDNGTGDLSLMPETAFKEIK